VLAYIMLVIAAYYNGVGYKNVGQQPQSADVGIIRGVAISVPGSPIPNASVYARSMKNIREEVRGTADIDGKFSLRVPSGDWFVHAYKEDLGYPDSFLWFGGGASEKAWQVVNVRAGQTTEATIELGPKFALLEILIKDEKGNSIAPGLVFTWQGSGDIKHRTSTISHDISGSKRYYIPPDRSFQFRVEMKGFGTWHSISEKGEEWMRLKSGETRSMSIVLKRIP
jgi:hypothetical protein